MASINGLIKERFKGTDTICTYKSHGTLHVFTNIISANIFFSIIFLIITNYTFVIDPHIRVGGTDEESVRKAKCNILEVLDSRSSRVTMKMDVSYTDHSHVIGKGGKSLKKKTISRQCRKVGLGFIGTDNSQLGIFLVSGKCMTKLGNITNSSNI